MGPTAAVSLYELLDGEPDPAKARKMATRELFAEGLARYRAGDFASARDVFEECRERAADDGAAALYVKRCDELVGTPPAGPWRGVWVLDAK